MALRHHLWLGIMMTASIAPTIALATDGYFSEGYGMKSEGMAGVSTARTDDSFGGANNPAQMVFVEDRFDAGVDWFSPKRTMDRSGAAIAPLNGSVTSGNNNFYLPQFGLNRMISPDLSVGVTVYGNGGMDTAYPQGNFRCPTPTFQFVAANALCGQGNLGVNLEQLIVAPTLSYKITPNQSIGIAPLIGYQRFAADGLQAFGSMSSAPAQLTNTGYSSSTGYGVRVGYLAKLADLSIGAAYATRMKMGNFSQYSGLFAEQGAFDIPENYNVGVMYQVTPALSIGADYQRINYSAVNSVGNASTNQAPLGANSGPGFGWQNVNAVKVGVQYAWSQDLILRAGYGKSNNPVQSSNVTFNILAPGVVQDHYTLGFTYSVSKDSEITMAYMHAARNTVTGSSLYNRLFPVPNAGGTETISLEETSLGIAWGMKF